MDGTPIGKRLTLSDSDGGCKGVPASAQGNDCPLPSPFHPSLHSPGRLQQLRNGPHLPHRGQGGAAGGRGLPHSPASHQDCSQGGGARVWCERWGIKRSSMSVRHMAGEGREVAVLDYPTAPPATKTALRVRVSVGWSSCWVGSVGGGVGHRRYAAASEDSSMVHGKLHAIGRHHALARARLTNSNTRVPLCR